VKINVDDYSYNRVLVESLIKRKGAHNYKEIASEYAVVACCPVFVVYYFIGEQLGFDDWTIKRMQSIAKFYQYTSVESKNDVGFSIGFDKNQFLCYT